MGVFSMCAGTLTYRQ